MPISAFWIESLIHLHLNFVKEHLYLLFTCFLYFLYGFCPFSLLLLSFLFSCFFCNGMCRFQASLIVQEPDSFPDSMFLDFTSGSAGKESACNAGDLGSIPGLGRSPGGGKGYPLQYSGLESSMDCIVHGVAKSWAQLSDFHFM